MYVISNENFDTIPNGKHLHKYTYKQNSGRTFIKPLKAKSSERKRATLASQTFQSNWLRNDSKTLPCHK